MLASMAAVYFGTEVKRFVSDGDRSWQKAEEFPLRWCSPEEEALARSGSKLLARLIQSPLYMLP